MFLHYDLLADKILLNLVPCHYKGKAVQASSYWPVRDIGNIYENDMLMTEYSVFMPYMGDYYQITPGWTEARTA